VGLNAADGIASIVTLAPSPTIVDIYAWTSIITLNTCMLAFVEEPNDDAV